MSTSISTEHAFPKHLFKTLRYFRNRLYASNHKRLADDCDTWMSSLIDAGWAWRRLMPELQAFISLCEAEVRK